MADSHLTITVGPAVVPSGCGCGTYDRCLCGDEGYAVMRSLALVSSRFAETTLLDPQGGAVILGADPSSEMDVELF